MKKVVVIGYGYVGQAMVQLFSGRFETSFYDIKHQPDKRLVVGADLAIVCVPTPEGPDGECDISAVDEVVSWIDAPLVCIKSTIPPGTTADLSVKYAKGLHFSPEFLSEPRVFVAPWKYQDPKDASKHTFVVVGGPRASEVLDFFAAVMPFDAHYVACRAVEAELAKYMDNAFMATKVTFCNEFARIADVFGVDYKRLRELWLLDPRIGDDHTMVFKDAPGFGGKCLPKDVSAIVCAAKAAGYVPELLGSVLKVNAALRKTS